MTGKNIFLEVRFNLYIFGENHQQMTVQKQLLLDIQKIEDSLLLNQLYQYLQLMKKMSVMPNANTATVLQFVGKVSTDEAQELMSCIENEFSTIEGEW